MVGEEPTPDELDQLEGEGTVDSSQGTASHVRSVDNKGRGTLVANSRGTLVNHHTSTMGTLRQEVNTASSGPPDIQNIDTYCTRFVSGGFKSRNSAGTVTNPHFT